MRPKSDGLVPRLVGEQPELVVENRVVDLLTDDRWIEPGAQRALGEGQPLLSRVVLGSTDRSLAALRRLNDVGVDESRGYAIFRRTRPRT